jgi:phosphatidylglycerophosphate synthase
MTAIPTLLIYSRLAIGLIILVLSGMQIDYYTMIAVSLLTIGLLTDIFDGIIARQFQVSTQKLRRLDSAIDQVFFLAVAVATFMQCLEFFTTHAVSLALLLGVEALTYVVSYIKFRKEIATHSIGAKVWTLFIFATLVQVMVQCQSSVLFTICFWVGLITRFEIIAIVLILKQWTNDVPTIYHASRLRQNKVIKRHKMFNG